MLIRSHCSMGYYKSLDSAVKELEDIEFPYVKETAKIKNRVGIRLGFGFYLLWRFTIIGIND